jgi:hypothetical protein
MLHQRLPVVQYADDIIIIIHADLPQGMHLKVLLNLFAMSTCLKVNYHMSSMVPLDVFDSKIQDLAAAFGYQVTSLPFTYLGLPMGTTSPE